MLKFNANLISGKVSLCHAPSIETRSDARLDIRHGRWLAVSTTNERNIMTPQSYAIGYVDNDIVVPIEFYDDYQGNPLTLETAKKRLADFGGDPKYVLVALTVVNHA